MRFRSRPAPPSERGSSFPVLAEGGGPLTADPLEPVLYAGAFAALTVFVVIGGVNQGLERSSRILMPALFVLILVLCGRSLNRLRWCSFAS